VRGDGPRAAGTADADVSAMAIQEDPVGGMTSKPVDRRVQFAYGCGEWPTWR